MASKTEHWKESLFNGIGEGASDTILREWILKIESVWSAAHPIDPSPEQKPQDIRNKEIDEIAKAVINDFSFRQARGLPQSQETLNWLARALERIADHEDPLLSLGLSPRPKHRPPDPETSIRVTWWVALAQKRGYSKAEAEALAAETFHRDQKTIQRDCRTQSAWLGWMTSDEAAWERQFLKQPLPVAKNNK